MPQYLVTVTFSVEAEDEDSAETKAYHHISIDSPNNDATFAVSPMTQENPA